jgi:hypothetical protein
VQGAVKTSLLHSTVSLIRAQEPAVTCATRNPGFFGVRVAMGRGLKPARPTAPRGSGQILVGAIRSNPCFNLGKVPVGNHRGTEWVPTRNRIRIYRARSLRSVTMKRRLVNDRGRDGRLSPGRPSLRTVQADLPHTALRSAVHPGGDWTSCARTPDIEKSPSLPKKALGQR